MNVEKVKNMLIKLEAKEVKINESMEKHTSFKIGGEAQIFACVDNIKSLIKILKYLYNNDINYYIIGNATNLLVSDDGIKGVVIKLGDKLKKIKIKNNKVVCESGVGLFELCEFCCRKGLSGLENLYGIPGSVGGAVRMNAGAYGTCVADCIEKVLLFDGKKVKWLKKDKLDFSYRHSIFCDNSEYCVLKVVFSLKKGNTSSIKETHSQLLKKRKDSQPYDKPSAGSVFKRNDKYIISQLIDELGLKGYKIGGAEISTKHAGFIINNGNATCKDVVFLIKYIQEKINESYGFVPKIEIELMGDFDGFTW